MPLLGAVVAREYGLPCIVGVKEATKVFRTGDMVVLSGSTGRIGKASNFLEVLWITKNTYFKKSC